MAKKQNKTPKENDLIRALHWLMEAEAGLPRAVGIRAEAEGETLTLRLKLFECLQIREEIVIEGVRDARKLLREFHEQQDMIQTGGK